MNKQVIGTVITRGASTFCNFLIAVLVARHAGPAVKGDVTLLITTVYFFVFFSNILGGQALVYLIPRNKIELLVIPAYLWSVVVAAIGLIFLKLTGLLQMGHVPSIAALSFLSSIITIHQTVLLARKQFSNANLLQVAVLLIQLSGIVVCFYYLKINDAYAYIYSSLLASAIMAIVSFFLIRKLLDFGAFFKYFSWNEMVQPFKHGLLFQLVEILQLLNLRLYFYQLGLQQGIQYLGIYSIGISILESVWILPRSIATVHYVSTSNSEEVKKEADRTLESAKLSSLLCAAALLVLFLVPSEAYVFVFGKGFSEVKHSIRYLFPGILVYSLWLVISSFYFGTGRYKELILSNVAGVASLIVFSALLIPKYVMSGAGLAASISFTFATTVLVSFFLVELYRRNSKPA